MENLTNNIPADEIASTTPATETTGEPVTTQAPVDLPADYLANGYNTLDGRDDPRYVLSYAKEIAAKLALMKKEYFRAFYREVDLNVRETIERKQLLVGLLVTRAHNAVRNGKAPEIFYEFMKRNAECITDHKTYIAFCDHMEAVYCYMN